MSYITKVREKSPLVFNIMNEVASNFSANGIIAVGASPSISNTPMEAEEMGKSADAVILNLGTLSEDRAEAMMIAGKAANEANVPVLIDPIAVGASEFRTKVIYDLLETLDIDIICANLGEIAVLGDALERMDSPDAAITENDPKVAEEVARKYDTIVISTGKTDVITDGEKTVLCKNGHKMLQNITTSGCVLTSVVGAFVGAAKDELFQASVEGTAAYAIAAELAMKNGHVKGPGSFIAAFLDELYLLDEEKIEKYKQLQTL